MELPFAESFKIKMVEPIQQSTKEERLQWIKEAKYNLFNLKSSQVFIDLLTDSGTGAMSDKQWAQLMTGDERYAGSSSYFNLKNTIQTIFGFEHLLPTHQGRAAENVLFSVLVKEGDIIPGNSHFDTTKGHIEYRKATSIDCTVDAGFDPQRILPFKGNVDIKKLENVFKTYPNDAIPFIIITLTCNSGGGQPVAMENLKQVAQLAKKHKVKVVFDSARFAENAYFIKTREEGYGYRTIKDIVKEMYSYCDAMTMSSKKDGLVNIGGFIAMSDPDLYQSANIFNIMYEGFTTYGGMAGRDLNALAQGLMESTEFEYLNARVKQVDTLAKKLIDFDIPIIKPTGGHAVFIDALTFFSSHTPRPISSTITWGRTLY